MYFKSRGWVCFYTFFFGEAGTVVKSYGIEFRRRKYARPNIAISNIATKLSAAQLLAAT